MTPSPKTPGEKIVVEVEAYLGNILPDFLLRRQEDIRAAQDALGQADYESIRIFGHRMKETGGAYGLEGVSEIGKALEKAAISQNLEQMAELLDRFANYLERLEIVYT